MRSFLLIVFITISLSTTWANETFDLEKLQSAVQQASDTEQQIDAQNELSHAYFKVDSTQAALQLLFETELLAEKNNYNKGLVESFNLQGAIFESKYDYTNALRVYIEALKIMDTENNDLAKANSKTNIGRVFLRRGDIDKAIENLNTALAYQENEQDVAAAANTHQLLGDAYIAKKRSGSAKEHYKRSLDLKIQQENYTGAAKLATQLGKIESDLGAYDSALVYYNMSLDLNSSIEDLPNIAKDYENIAQTYYIQEDINEAIEANEVAINIWKDLDDNIGLANIYKDKALYKAAKGKEKDALRYLERASNYLDKGGNAPETHQIYKAIAGIYESLGAYRLAYQNHKAYATTKANFFSQEKDKAVLEIETKYKSEFAAVRQQQKITQLEIKQSNANKVRTFLIALIALIGALAATLYFSYRAKKKDNKALKERNSQIERQKFEIDAKNIELNEKNEKLDVLNSKLLDEISERESIEKSSFARDSFLAGMSHEMRTPMNAIVGLTHILLEENPKDGQVENLRNLLFSANNLTVFINDILDFSKIEAGKLTLESRTFQPKKIFDEIYYRFKKPIETEGLSIQYNYDDIVPNQLIGDPARLNQIVHNLLSNSLQKTKEGNISMNVSLQKLDPQEVILKVSLQDTGEELSKNELDKMYQSSIDQEGDIFDGYERYKVGLAMAKRLVDLQNGKLEVHTDSSGTIYNVYIPCKQEEKKNIQAPNQEKPTPQRNYIKGTKILVVEDNKINQLVVDKLLTNLGASITTVDNGQEAVDTIYESDFDLILMDIQMPVMDGYKATSEIRNMSDPRKNNIPIIALTASAFLSEAEKAKLFGMNDHVGKPFGPEDLLEKINLCLEKFQSKSAIKAQG